MGSGRALYNTRRVSPIYECIVVGLGAAGSAALYHLAKRGVKALGLEAQAFVGHPMGSSHGQSRIMRLIYHEEEGQGGYTSLLRRAYELWHRLELEAQNCKQGSLFRQTGCLNISCPAAEPVRSSESNTHTCYNGSKASAEKYSLQHEIMDASQLRQRFPAYSESPDRCKALFDPAGGMLFPEAALHTFIDLAKGSGAEVEMNSPVLEWGKVDGEGGSCYTVHTPLETHFAKKIIFAAGPWMPTMVPHLANYLHVERQVVGWFHVTDQESSLFSPEHFPVFVLDDDDAYYYGFPMDDDGCVKLGKYHHLGQQISSMTAVDRLVQKEDEQTLRRCLIDYFPKLKDAPMKKSSVCLFTNTVDGHFIVDHHPHYSPDIVLASACSGHGFKFAPVVGEILADLAMQETSYSSHDIDMFRLAHRPVFDSS
jgi:sarcosine oxidase